MTTVRFITVFLVAHYPEQVLRQCATRNAAFSHISTIYMGSLIDVTRTIFTKAMFAWSS